jgi:hypothetical protein
MNVLSRVSIYPLHAKKWQELCPRKLSQGLTGFTRVITLRLISTSREQSVDVNSLISLEDVSVIVY